MGIIADKVYKNGVIYTMDDRDSVATTIAIKGDTIIYVGDEDGVCDFVNGKTIVIDLEGKMVTPGFLNGHEHVASYEKQRRVSLMLNDTAEQPSIHRYICMIRDYIRANPGEDILLCKGLNLNVFGENIPDNKWLNDNFPDKPIVMADESIHGMLLNQKAMDVIGITRDTPVPEGGMFHKYNDGELTGFFADCRSLVMDHVNFFGEFFGTFDSEHPLDHPVYRDAFEEFQTLANSYGITGVNDGSDGHPNTWNFFNEYSKTGKMSMRLNLPYMTGFGPLGEQVEEIKAVMEEGKKYCSDYLNVNQIKHQMDGTVEGKTALLLAPYEAAAEMGDSYYGEQYSTQEELNAFVQQMDAAGYQVMIHSIGDGACRACRVAFENAIRTNGYHDARHTIVHACLMDDEDIMLAGKLGIYVSIQPIWAYNAPQFSDLERRLLGEERYMSEYKMRSMLEAGIVMSGGADYNVTQDFSPLSAIQCGVTHSSPYPVECDNPAFARNPEQGISAYDMLKVYTINCAKQMFMEDIIGSLAIGKKADMVILEKDITKIDPKEISSTKICTTIFGGEVVYES